MTGHAVRFFLKVAIVTATGVSLAGEWDRISPPPRDILGREMPPGAGAAFCYVPPWRGFFLYGGYWPTYSNAGWLYRPEEGLLELLWPDDQWGWNTQKESGFMRLPRAIRWSLDRPGPARDICAVYCPDNQKVYCIGGHPGRQREWFGSSRLGTWELDTGTRQFRFITSEGPAGLTQVVYASRAKAIIAAPQHTEHGKVVTWVFDVATDKWRLSQSPAQPRATPHAAWVYDSHNELAVYFNAWGRTWVYDPGRDRWQQRSPAISPTARWHAAAIYDRRSRRVILHGGLSLKGGKPIDSVYRYGSRVWRPRDAIYHRDTWAYDVELDRWYLVDATPPAANASVQDACGYDTINDVAVFYDPARGFFARHAPEGYRRRSVALPIEIGDTLRRRMARDHPIAPDERQRTWLSGMERLGSDSWLDPNIATPSFGDTSFDYHPDADAIYWIGGCLGAAMGTYEDYSYTNQVVVFDMTAGRWQLRRANHPWMPHDAANQRPGNGCGRGFCYDSRRRKIWTLGGVTGFGLPGTHGMQQYDLLADRFAVAVQSVSGWGSNCGLIHLPQQDRVLAINGGYQPVDTFEFDPETKRWEERAVHPPRRSQYIRAAHDPRLGVLIVSQIPRKGWKQGQRLSRRELNGLLEKHGWRIGVYVYQAGNDRWSELRVAGADGLDNVEPLGMTYDSQNRTLLLFTGSHDRKRQRLAVWRLDLDRLQWQRGTSSPLMGKIHAGSVVYVPRHNVIVLAAGKKLYLYRNRESITASMTP